MRPAAFAFVTTGFMASFAAAAVVASFAVTKLEDATERMTKSALVASGQSWAHVETDGTLVYLSGTAPDEKKRIQALDAISGVISSSRIRNLMDVEESVPAIAPEFALEILRSGNDISLIGITPSEGERDIITLAIDAIDGVSLINMKESTDWDAPDGWQEALEFGTAVMARLERAKISIQPGQVNVTAVVRNAAEKSLLISELQTLRPETVELNTDITAPRPIFSPYSLTYVSNETETTLLCHALTLDGAETILDAANKPKQTCEIGLGAPTENWAEVAIAGIAAVKQMGSGRFEIQDSTATLTAPEDYDADKFDGILETLQTALPDAYLLRSELPQKQVVTDEDNRPYFNATLSPEGNAILTGVVVDTISQTTLNTYSQSKFGFESVKDNTKIAQFAPHGWTFHQLVAIEVLSLLHNGRIEVTEDTVTVRGKGQVVDLQAEIQTILENGFGADARFDIKVEEIPQPPTEEEYPDAQECVGEITILITENPIMFAPSSATLTTESETIVSKIALILNRCKHAVFEIAGHTDSQGREGMNKTLSQNRADAVLDALLARNVLLGDILAVGYGESQPIADNETEEGRLANRRIVFTLLDAMPEPAPDYSADPDVTLSEEAPVRRPENLKILEPASEETDG